jgi:hypothetical protein
MPRKPDHKRPANRVLVMRNYLGLWQQYFSYFADNLRDHNITEGEEQEFAEIMSRLAFDHFKFQELSKPHFTAAPKILEVLQETISLEAIKALPDATFSKIQIEWHTLFISMYKALGKMTAELRPKDQEELKRLTASLSS